MDEKEPKKCIRRVEPTKCINIELNFNPLNGKNGKNGNGKHKENSH